MTKEDKRLLLKQATKLAVLGVTVERERNKLKKLAERGVAYSASVCRLMRAFSIFLSLFYQAAKER